MFPEDLKPPVWVLRMGHRPGRDKRVTTHVALLARSFGARGVLVDRRDERLHQTVEEVVKRFGGNFALRSGVSPKREVENFPGAVVHLTMYGEPLRWHVKELKDEERLLVVVGAEKVPGWVYQKADYNISISQQPHSEISSLAVFLHELYGGVEEELSFPGAREVILPAKKGKKVISLEAPPLSELKKEEGWIPDEKEALRILVDVGTPPAVISHCLAAMEFSKDLLARVSKNVKIDERLLLVGSLLHDVGRSRSHGIDHGVIGGELLRGLGVDERLAKVAERHIGAGLDEEDASRLGLPPKRYVPETLEEKIITHIDNMLADSERVPLSTFLERMRKRGLEKVARRALDIQMELETLLDIKFDELIG